MKDDSPSDWEFARWLASEPENNCFKTMIPRSNSMLSASLFKPGQRSYLAKYPGECGRAFRQLADELLARLAAQGQSEQKQFAHSAA